MPFDPERNSRIYPTLSPEDQARYRAMVEEYRGVIDDKPGDGDILAALDQQWIEQEYHWAMDYFQEYLKRRKAGGR